MPPVQIGSGRDAEEFAVAYVQGKGWRIAARNFSIPQGELDIVAWDGGCLVFVEVKFLSDPARGFPEDRVTPKKARNLLLAARAYLQRHHSGEPPVSRFDVLAILPSPSSPSGYDVRHWEDALEES